MGRICYVSQITKMHFLQLPHLVLRNILKQMSYGNLFLFSLISKRSLQLVRSVGWKQIKYIQYSSRGSRADICFANSEGFFETFIRLWTMCDRATMKVTISRQEIDAELLDATQILVLYYEQPWSPSVEMIHKQIKTTFGSQVTYFLEKSGFHETSYLPQTMDFKQTRFNSPFTSIEADLLQDYFDANPIQDIVHLAIQSLNGKLSANCKVYDAQILRVTNDSTSWNPDFLWEFRGREVCLLNVNQTNEDVIEFLKQWESGEKFQNLERMEIELEGWDGFSLDEIRSNVEIKELPESVGAQVLNVAKRPLLHPRLTIVNQIVTSSYVVRNDGIVGILGIFENLLIFSVKKYTEKEMRSY